MPTIAGTYYSEMNRELGAGATQQTSTQRLSWFAIYLNDNQVLLRAMNAEGLPTLVSKILSSKDFFSNYTLDHSLYTTTIQPLLESLGHKLSQSNGQGPELIHEERMVLGALQFDQEHLPGIPKNQREELSFDMLSKLPNFDEVALEHKSKINHESIASRKQGRFDEAIDLYGALLRVNPEDDHIFFNLARVHYEKKDIIPCRKYLLLALENDPNFEEARKFLNYIDKQDTPTAPEGRQHLRYRFHTPQACTLKIHDTKLEGRIVDLSATGIRFAPNTTLRSALQQGQQCTIWGLSDLISSILSENQAQIVWTIAGQYGATLASNLDTKTPEFKRIIAYATLT
ncbi:MAG: PilZ domain-containing protein [Proteobacteria bacterium]|nr:PilZ domain-containing protein [Pseudomonadota bacterium]